MAPAGPADEGVDAQAKFLDALPFVLSRVYSEDRCAVRATCRGARDIHDSAANEINILSSKKKHDMLAGRCPFERVPAPEAIGRSISQLVDRGCRPKYIGLHLPWEHDNGLAERQSCAFLDGFAAAGSVVSVSMSFFTPLTSAIATAVAGVSPKLTSLVIVYTTIDDAVDEQRPLQPEFVPPLPTPSSVDAAAAGAERLLKLAGPRLTKLSLHLDRQERFFPRRALGALSHCQALRELMLSCTWPAEATTEGITGEMALLGTLSSLPSLRQLDLEGGALWLPHGQQRRTAAAYLKDSLSRLTGLESLRLNLHRLQHYSSANSISSGRGALPSLEEQLAVLEHAGRFAEAAELRAVAAVEWSAVASAAQHMPRLAELRVPLQANVADLAALTALTCLRVGALTLPAALGGGGGCAFALPPGLRRLETHAPLPMRVLASLQPPSPPPGKGPCSLLAGGRLSGSSNFAWCVALEDGDVNGQGRLTSDSVATLKRGISVLTRLDFRENPMWPEDSIRGLRLFSRSGLTVWPPLPAGEPDDSERPGSHVASWLGDVGDLRLEVLGLEGLALPSRDILGLARCLPGLRELDLTFSFYAVASLPLLSSMKTLQRLYVSSQTWEWPPEMEQDPLGTAYGEDVVQAAFLALTLAPPPEQVSGVEAPSAGGSGGLGIPLPQLELLVVEYPEGEPVEPLERALAAARQELAARNNGAELLLEAY